MNPEISENAETHATGQNREREEPSLPMSLTLCRIIGWSLVAYWAAAFIGTHVPAPKMPDLPEHSDKLMHFGAYAGLSFLLGSWLATRRRLTPREYAGIFGITAGYAILDELLQAIPLLNRHCDLADALADCAGSLLGLAALYVVVRTYRWSFAR